MQAVIDFFKSLGPLRLAIMGGVVAVLIAFFGYLIIRATTPQMAPLYTELTLEDSAAVVKELERQAISYELKNDGAIIFVPKERVARLRMMLAEQGMPKGGGVGYEVFDKSDALGTTSFVQNINHMRALEGELSRSIREIDRVQAARVHLVIPERPLFSRDKVEPSASIVLKVRGILEPQQVQAIRYLVASAVTGLKPQRVSIVDESGRLLANGTADETSAMSIQADERQIAYERRLREQVESILTSVVGPGRARVQLTADFDFNRITQTADHFDPEGRVVRSTQTREESSTTGDPQGPVSVGNELPGTQPNVPPNTQETLVQRDQNRKSEEIINYDISRTTETKIIEGGRINRVSVAVLVDGIYNKNERGESVYQERSAEELNRIAALVRSAIGFDQKRGDQVEVVNLRFAENPANIADEQIDAFTFLRLTKEDIIHVVELGVMLLLGIVVLLVVVRPLLRRVMTRGASNAPASDLHHAMLAPSDEPIVPPANPTSRMIEIAQVQGQVHAQSVAKVGELADMNPHETVSIIRQWLHEGT